MCGTESGVPREHDVQLVECVWQVVDAQDFVCSRVKNDDAQHWRSRDAPLVTGPCRYRAMNLGWGELKSKKLAREALVFALLARALASLTLMQSLSLVRNGGTGSVLVGGSATKKSVVI